MRVWKSMEADHEFHMPHYGVSSDEQKRRAAIQLARLNHLEFLPSNINNVGYKLKVNNLMLNKSTVIVHYIVLLMNFEWQP